MFWFIATMLVASGSLIVDVMRRLSRVLRILAYTIIWPGIIIGLVLGQWILFVDFTQILFLTLCTVVSIAISLYSEGYLRILFGRIHHLQLVIDMTLILLIMLFTARNLLELTVLWISIELVTFLLIMLEKGLENWNIGLKYLVICVTAGDISLFSWIALTSTVIGVDKALLSDFSVIAQKTIDASHPIITVLVLLGFLAKLGQIPFHVWLTDTYSEAPSPVTAIFSGIMSKMSIYAILRLISLLNLNETIYMYLMLVTGFLTSIYASIMASAQADVKRMIAYSSMMHYGIMTMLLSLVFISDTVFSLLYLYVYYHGLLKTHIFLNIASIELLTNTRDMYRLGYIAKVARNLYDKVLYSILSLMGLPPTAGFFVKALLIYFALNLAIKGMPPAFFFLVGFVVSSIFAIVYSVKYLGVYVGSYTSAPFRPSIMLSNTQYRIEYMLSLSMIIIPAIFLLILKLDPVVITIYGIYVVAILAILALRALKTRIVFYETPHWIGGVEV